MPTPAFAPVRLTESTDPVVEIVLGGGEHVQVRAGASAELVRAAVLALRGPADTDTAPVEMRSADLLLLLAGTDLSHTRRRRWYERVV